MNSTRSDTHTSAGQDTAMQPNPLSRRTFLALGGGAVLLAACSSSSKSGFTQVAPGIVSIDLYASPKPQRFAFALLAKEGYASGKPASIALAPRGTTPTKFASAVPQTLGLPAFRGVYTVMATLDR